MILLEAMAAEVPVVTTAVGGIPDVVEGGHAWLVPPGDPAAIAAALTEILSDHATAADRVRAAKRRLKRDFAVGPWVERHREIYASILDQKIV